MQSGRRAVRGTFAGGAFPFVARQGSLDYYDFGVPVLKPFCDEPGSVA
jgi:hypothetical protein